MMIRTLLGLMVLLLGLAAQATAQTATATDNEPLLPGDVIRVNVWREPDWNGDFTVQEDHTVALPRVGVYDVAGKGRLEVERELVQTFSRDLLQPSVEIIVLRRITIAGEVRHPGLFPVDPTLALTDALILAGGPLPTAAEDKVVLIRDGVETKYRVSDAALLRDLHLQSGDQLYVPKRNWFLRNWQVYTSMFGTILSISAFFIARR